MIDRIYVQTEDYKIKQKMKQLGIPDTVRISRSEINGNVSIGEFTYIAPWSIITTGVSSKVAIGKYCAIGRYVSITSRGHSLELPTADEEHENHEHVEKDTIIGDYVWIGDHAFIKHGVIIGNYAIIGAGSVVVKDVKPFEIVGGVPAKHIRFNTEHYRYTAVKKA